PWMMPRHEGVGTWAAALPWQARITVEGGGIVVTAVDPEGFRRVGDVENHYALVAIGQIKAIIVFFNLVASDHLIASIPIFAVGLPKGRANMLADNMEPRHELRLRWFVIIEDVQLLDLDLFLRFGRCAAHVDIAVVHLHAMSEAAFIVPLTKQLRVARVGHIV